MAYELRWGRWTWIPALLLGLVLGTLILAFSWNVMGEHWHTEYYVPILGYYVLLSICQSHYFKSDPRPNVSGFARQGVSIAGGTAIYFFHGIVLEYVFGIDDPNMKMAGQFLFIVLGFFLMGWDDFMFRGALSRWIGRDWLKAAFWYVVIWIAWGVVFGAAGGIPALGMDFNPVGFFWFLGSFQWVIMMSLMIAITWREFLETIRFPNDHVRGLSLLSFSLIAGFSIGYICYLLINAVGPGIAEADKWHHVLYMGTYPLIPIVIFGIYSNHFNFIGDIGKKTAARTGFLVVLVIAGYFVFRLLVAPSGIFGDHEWYHHFDLVFNFTCSIIPLSHHWFNARLGFVKEV